MEFAFKENTPSEKQRLLDALNLLRQGHGVSAEAIRGADLALEEHLSNIFAYGFDTPGEHPVLVRFQVREGWLQIEVRDEGRPFNPVAHPAPDLTVPAEDRPIGGLGIHMIRSVMDELEYRRENERNVLIMRKRIQAGPAPG